MYETFTFIDRIALATVFPDKNWLSPQSFVRDHLSSPSNQREFFDLLAKQLNVKKPQEWYKINRETVLNYRGATILRRYNGSLISGTQITRSE